MCPATAMLMLDIAVVNTAISDIGADLHSASRGLQWVVDAYTLALATIVLTVGSLADRFGRRAVFTSRLRVFTIASLVCALGAGHRDARLPRGPCRASAPRSCSPSSLALLANAFPGPRERAKAFAAYGATIGASFAIGPLVGGALTSGLDWRCDLPRQPAARPALPRDHAPLGRGVEVTRTPARSTWPGQLTLTAGLFLLVLALLRGNDDGWTSATIVASLVGAVVFLGAFIAVEARVKEPMLPLGLFRIRAFTGAQVAAFAISASFFAVFLYTTIYLQQILGLSAIEAGLVYLPGHDDHARSSRPRPRTSCRSSARARMVAGGLLLVGIGQALLTVAAVDSSWTVFLPGEIIALIGTGIFNPAVSAGRAGLRPRCR